MQLYAYSLQSTLKMDAVLPSLGMRTYLHDSTSWNSLQINL